MLHPTLMHGKARQAESDPVAHLDNIGQGVEQAVGGRDAMMQQLPQKLTALPMGPAVHHYGPELNSSLSSKPTHCIITFLRVLDPGQS